ncbi:MAG TPA: caspase family protein [Blastocatellia bacterium]|nr:caspase family protein [Blastocatellia bacterium]
MGSAAKCIIGLGLLSVASIVRAGTQTDLFRPSKYDQVDGTQGKIRALAFDPQVDRLASAGKDGSIIIRDLASKQVVRRLEGHSRQVNALVFRRDGRFLASASDDRTVRLWNMQDGSSRVLAGHNGAVLSVAFNPSGDMLASGGDDKQVILWSVETASRIGMHAEHKKKVTQVLFIKDESLISVGEARLIVEWNVSAKRVLRSWQDSAVVIDSAAASPSGDWLTLGAEKVAERSGVLVGPTTNRGLTGEIRIYSVATGGLQKTFDVGPYELTSLSISADNNYLAAAHQAVLRSALVIWDIKRGEQVALLEPPSKDDLTAVAFSPNGRWLASGFDSGRINIWKTEGIIAGAPTSQELRGRKLVFLTKRDPLFSFRQPTTLAMLDLDALGLDASLAQSVSEQIRARIVGAPNIRLIERQKVDRVLQEQRFQHSGQTDALTAARIGKILNISRIALGSLSRLGRNIVLSVQLVDVETAAIEGIRQLACNSCVEDDLIEAVAYLEPALAMERAPSGAEPSAPRTQTTESDTNGPFIKLTYPAADGERASRDEIVLQGIVNDVGGLTSINVNVSAEGGTRGLTVAKWREQPADVTLKDGPKSYQISHPIKLAPGSNVITVTARNLAGVSEQISRVVYRESDDVAAPASRNRPADQRWAFIVGISDYEDPKIPRLKYAHRDAEDFKKFLQTPGGGGYKTENIVFITNQGATWERILEEVREFSRRPGRDDQVTFYFAAHGTPDPGRPENIYLIAYNTKLDKLAGTALSIREIELALRENLRAQKVVLLADTCYSGAFKQTTTRAVMGEAEAINYAFNEAIRRSKPGTFVLTSALGNEYSQEGEQWGGGHGVFTWYLLQGLSGNADTNGDGLVTAYEVFLYVSENVKRDTNDRQHPASLSSEYDPTLPLAVSATKTGQPPKQ